MTSEQFWIRAILIMAVLSIPAFIIAANFAFVAVLIEFAKRP